MRRSIRTLFAATVALSAAGIVPTQAQTNSGSSAGYSPFLDDSSFDPIGPYVGVSGGGSFFNDVSPNGAGTDVKSQFQNGYVGLGTVGWNFGDGLRAELEGGYRRSDVAGVRNAGPGAATGALGMTTVMVNGLYDFDLNRFGMPMGGLVPHLGVGVGWADPRFDHAGPYNGSLLSGHDSLFAYQGIAGFDYRIAPQVKLSLDYKYLGTESGNFYASPGAGGETTARTSIQDQAVLLGVRYEFGSPPPAPQPVAPPPAYQPPPPVVRAPEAQRAFQVFFDFNKSDLTGAARQVIKAAATTAQTGNFVHLVVTGHTDTVGSAQYNQGLSERRAAAVKNELVADGLPDGEITTLGVGKTGLLVPTADGVREAQNRRATIELGSNAGS
jgi:OmpA-OmpF porin, OOP family